MLELRLVEGSVLKKVVDAIRDLVQHVNFDCSRSGFSLQARDPSLLAAVSILLHPEAFEHFRCDRSISMPINLKIMAEMLRCAGNDDIITVKADDSDATVTFLFECPGKDKISEFEMKLTDKDNEQLSLPEGVYDAIVRIPSAVFSKISRDLSSVGDTVTISVTKGYVKFSTKGDIGTANVVCRQNTSVDKPEEATVIEMNQEVCLTFPLRYFKTITKATSLSSVVTISLAKELPVVVEYKIAEIGYVRIYLTPKV